MSACDVPRLRILAVAALMSAAIPLAQPSLACTCQEISIEEYYFWADTVFAGRVVAQGDPDLCLVTYQVDVYERWKGDVVGSVVVNADGPMCSTCGVEFVVGDELIWYVSGNPSSGYFVDLCQRVVSSTSSIDRAFLGDPEWVLPVEGRSWGRIKTLYRESPN